MYKAKWLIRFIPFFSAIALLFALAGNGAIARDPVPQSPDSFSYYYGDGQKIPLAVSTEFIAVRLREGITLNQVEPFLRTIPCLESLSERQEIPTPRLTLLRIRPDVSQDEVLEAMTNLRLRPQFAFANPVYVFSDSKLIVTDEFIAQFKHTASFQDIADFNEKHGVEIVRQLYGMPNAYALRVSPNSGKDALGMANMYHEGGDIVEYSHPDFVRIIEPSFTPNDPYYDDQWFLHNTGQSGGTPGADIHAQEAWDIEKGMSTVIIAVLDTGVDLIHEDLRYELTSGYDMVDDDSDPSPTMTLIPSNAHGTCVAGIAAADTDNSLGIAGVCPGCRVMPIRIGYSNVISELFGFAILRDSWAAEGINWAWQNYADVLSNSWSLGPPSTAVTNAIRDAKQEGRFGRGAVIVFASGNENDDAVNYPAYLEEVIAVGATNESDERCDPDDWGHEQGSNYGPNLDVVAPGIHLYTTDIRGAGGYNHSLWGHYYGDFGGTSGATPQVAGLAGLILSLNPRLTSAQVQDIIQQTADDKGSPGRDDEYGYGRINAHSALLAVPPQPVIVDTDYDSGITLGSYAEIYVKVRNVGGRSDDGAITISFPGFTSSGDDQYVDLVASSSDLPGYEENPHGSLIWHRNGYQFQANYLMVEWTDTSWQSEEENYLRIRVKPQGPGTFMFYVRSAMGLNGVYINDPSSSSHTDQQGWEVNRYTITVTCTDPPTTPYNPSPADGATGVSINTNLSWSGGHPCSGESVTYDVYFEANDGSPDNLICNDVSSPSCDPGTLSYGAHYYWKVVANGLNGPSPGQVWDFYTEEEPCTDPPTTPYNPSPSDGDTDVSINANLSWSGGHPCAGESVTYDVYFEANDSSPDNLICNDVSSPACDPGTLNYGTHYYWKVVANGLNGPSPGQVWDFYTEEEPCTDPPTTPYNPSPADGDTGVSINADLSWSGGHPCPGESVTYGVYLEANDSTPDNLICNDVSSPFCDPGTLGYNTHYYWQVVANGLNGPSLGSVWDFTTAEEPCTDPPTTPYNPSPADGATDVSINADLSWFGGHPCPGESVTYDVYFEANDTFPDNLICSDVSSPTCDPGTLNYGTHYYWQVVANGLNGPSYPDQVWDFTTQVGLPGAFSKNSPSNGATGVSTDPTLRWHFSSGADSYEYCIDTTNNSTCDGSWTNVGSNTGVGMSGLSEGTTYHWQVRARNAAGTTEANGGTWWHFATTEEPCTDPPTTPYNPSPADGATGISINADLSWSGGHPCSGESVTYDVYFEANDSSPDNLICNDVSSPSCDPGTLSYGTHYYWQIVANGLNGPSTGPVWDFYTQTEGVPNDLCTNAIVIPSNGPFPYTNSQDTTQATTSADDPDQGCGQGVNSNSVWYTFTPDTDGWIDVETCGSNYDTVLSVFDGACGAFGSSLVCNDDACGLQSQIVGLPVIAGTTYYIEITDYGSPGGGVLSLTLNFYPGGGISVEVRNQSNESAVNAYVQVYSDITESADYDGYTDSVGFIDFPDVPPGTYTIVVTSWNDHFLLMRENVTAPATLSLDTIGTAQADVYTYGLDGTTPVGAGILFAPFLRAKPDVGWTDGNGHLQVNVTPHSYSIIAASFGEPYFLVKPEMPINGVMEVVFDPTQMPTGEVTFDLIDFSGVRIGSWGSYSAWSWYFYLNDDQTMTFSPDTYSMGPDLMKPASEDTWYYTFDGRYSSYQVNAGASETIHAGGDFTACTMPDKSFYNAGEDVNISNSFGDTFGNEITWIEKYTSDQVMLGELGARGTVSPDREQLPKEKQPLKGEVQASGWSEVCPTITVKDPNNQTIANDNSCGIWWWDYLSTLSSSATSGIYSVSLSLDTGPHQGVVEVNGHFTVNCIVGDVNCNCEVKVDDIAEVANRWQCQCGDTCYDPLHDINKDGIINVVDIMLVVAHWGEICF